MMQFLREMHEACPEATRHLAWYFGMQVWRVTPRGRYPSTERVVAALGISDDLDPDLTLWPSLAAGRASGVQVNPEVYLNLQRYKERDHPGDLVRAVLVLVTNLGSAHMMRQLGPDPGAGGDPGEDQAHRAWVEQLLAGQKHWQELCKSELTRDMRSTRWSFREVTAAQLQAQAPQVQVAWDRILPEAVESISMGGLLEARARAERLGLDWANPAERALAERCPEGLEATVAGILLGA